MLLRGIRWSWCLDKDHLQVLWSGMSAGRRRQREGLRCTNITWLSWLSFQVCKPGVRGMLEKRRHFDGDVVNGILGAFCHDADVRKIDWRRWTNIRSNHYLRLLWVPCDENREWGSFNWRRVKWREWISLYLFVSLLSDHINHVGVTNLAVFLLKSGPLKRQREGPVPTGPPLIRAWVTHGLTN